MVGMDCQVEMVEMESQEAKEKRETLVYRDHLVCKVCIHFIACTYPLVLWVVIALQSNSSMNMNCTDLNQQQKKLSDITLRTTFNLKNVVPSWKIYPREGGGNDGKEAVYIFMFHVKHKKVPL